MAVNTRVPSKPLLVSLLIFAAATILALDARTTPHARAASEPQAGPPAMQQRRDIVLSATAIPRGCFRFIDSISGRNRRSRPN